MKIKKELFRSVEGKLDVDNREGYFVSLLNNGNLLFEHLHVEDWKNELRTEIKQNNLFNSESEWSLDLCLKLHACLEYSTSANEIDEEEIER